MPIPLDTSPVPFHSTINKKSSSVSYANGHQSAASLRNNVHANASLNRRLSTSPNRASASLRSEHKDGAALGKPAPSAKAHEHSEALVDAPTSSIATPSGSAMASPPTARICVLPHHPGSSISCTSHSVGFHYNTMSQPNSAANKDRLDPHARTVPVPLHRVIYYRRQPRQQFSVNEMSAKLANEARQNFFHGNFTSGHGAYFTAPNRAQQMAYSLPYPTAGTSTMMMPAQLAANTTATATAAANTVSRSRSRGQMRSMSRNEAGGASVRRVQTSMPRMSQPQHQQRMGQADTGSHTSLRTHPHSGEGDVLQHGRATYTEESEPHHHRSPQHLPVALASPAAAGESLSLQSGFLEAPVVLKPRARSADARLMQSPDKNHTGLPGHVQEASYSRLSQDVAQLAQSSRHFTPQPLSPQTIALTRSALRAFEMQKVKIPLRTGSSDQPAGDRHSYTSPTAAAPAAKMRVTIRVDGHTVEIPVETPLLLARHDTLPAVRHVSANASHPVMAVPAIPAAGYADDAARDVLDGGEYVLDEGEEELITWGAALADLVYLAAPATVSIACTFLMSIIPLAFIGKELGEKDLTGASVGYFVTSIFIVYPMVGLTFAMDTLCSHEYGRDPLSDEMGLVLQRGIVIDLVILTPLLACIYGLDFILTPIYGSQIAHTASDFLHFAPLFFVPLILCVSFNKFLCNQMQPHIATISLVASTVLMPLLQLKLTPMGVRYTMLGMAIATWVQLAVVVTITLFNPYTRTTLGALRLRRALNVGGMRDYMRLAVPSAVFVCAESAAFDISVLLCAWFGTADGAAWSCIQNLLFVFASFSGGLSTSACANIGRCIGANEPQSARRFALLAVATAFALGAMNSALLVVFFDFFMSLFGVSGRTFDVARRLIYLLPVFHTADSVQFTFQGIFSGLGKNNLGAVILLLSLWGVGIPLAIVLGSWLHWRSWGVCLGLVIGLCIETPAMFWALTKINFPSICDDFLAHEQFEQIVIEDHGGLTGVNLNDTLSKYNNHTPSTRMQTRYAQNNTEETYVQKFMRHVGLARRRSSPPDHGDAHEYTALLAPHHSNHVTTSS